MLFLAFALFCYFASTKPLCGPVVSTDKCTKEITCIFELLRKWFSLKCACGDGQFDSCKVKPIVQSEHIIQTEKEVKVHQPGCA